MSRAPTLADLQDNRRVGSIRVLATHSHDFTRPQTCKRLLNSVEQRPKIVNVVAGGNDDNDADA
jgi:hypothetical protein